MPSLEKLTLDELPEMLTVQQTADYIRLSKNSIYTLCQKKKEQGGMPSFKSGNTRRIRKSALIEWINDQEKQSAIN
jgi:excisionase family DNA binding protein